MSELELKIQQHVMQYLSNAASLADLENWFAPVLWDIDEEDPSTREMAGSVHILISEFSRGDRTVESLREGLAKTIRASRVNRSGTALSSSRF